MLLLILCRQFFFILLQHVFAYGQNGEQANGVEDENYIRHVVENDIKSPIFGSNSYNPIKNAFEPCYNDVNGGVHRNFENVENNQHETQTHQYKETTPKSTTRNERKQRFPNFNIGFTTTKKCKSSTKMITATTPKTPQTSYIKPFTTKKCVKGGTWDPEEDTTPITTRKTMRKTTSRTKCRSTSTPYATTRTTTCRTTTTTTRRKTTSPTWRTARTSKNLQTATRNWRTTTTKCRTTTTKCRTTTTKCRTTTTKCRTTTRSWRTPTTTRSWRTVTRNWRTTRSCKTTATPDNGDGGGGSDDNDGKTTIRKKKTPTTLTLIISSEEDDWWAKKKRRFKRIGNVTEPTELTERIYDDTTVSERAKINEILIPKALNESELYIKDVEGNGYTDMSTMMYKDSDLFVQNVARGRDTARKILQPQILEPRMYVNDKVMNRIPLSEWWSRRFGAKRQVHLGPLI